jgi:CRISPR/Cas system CMR-associated protein Cmr3 (group 5 of RAMP superfamily)
MSHGRVTSSKSNFETTEDDPNQKDLITEFYKEGKPSLSYKKNYNYKITTNSTNSIAPLISNKNLISHLNSTKSDTRNVREVKKKKKRVTIKLERNEIVEIESFKIYNQEMRFKAGYEIEIKKSDCTEECAMLLKRCLIY